MLANGLTKALPIGTFMKYQVFLRISTNKDEAQ